MTVETIPLSKLSAWKGNVRKTAVTEGLDELTASIRAHGLLSPLTVQKREKGERRVIAGQRRLAALRALQKEGAIPADHPVPCMIVSADADATEISLTENVVRTQMHPADQFEAFRDLIEKGASIGDIAARFGVSESTVTKRLMLARVSPKLLGVYRKGGMTLEQVAALTLTDDHALQEKVWDEAQGWRREPRGLRAAFTEGKVCASDKRVKLIGGLEAYEAAGGNVRRDLFDQGDAGYISDLTLLNQLVAAKLEEVVAEVRGEGWKWVQVIPDFDWSATREYDTVQSSDLPLTPEQEVRLSELATQYDELEAQGDETELTDEQEAKLQQVQTEIDALKDRPEIYRSEDISRAGAFISIGYQGRAEIRRGYVKPEDQEEDAAVAQEAGAGVTVPVVEDVAIPASLIEDLTAQRTAAMRVEFAKRPSLALATVVYTLAASTLRLGPTRSCLKLTVQQTWLEPLIKHPDESLAFKECGAEKPLLAELPTDEAALWQFCLERSDKQLMQLLAVLVAPGVDAVDYKSGAKACRHAHQLADALQLDMKKHFKATAETYFSRLPKTAIIEALVDMDGGTPVSPATEKLKKGALADMAERTYEAGGGKWLPPVLRSKPDTVVEADDVEDEIIEDAA